MPDAQETASPGNPTGVDKTAEVVTVRIWFGENEVRCTVPDKQFTRFNNGKELWWQVRVSEADRDVPSEGETRKYKYASVGRVPTDGSRPPLNAEQWRILRLSLDGVFNDTVPAEECRREAGYLADIGTYVWEDYIPTSAVTTAAAVSKGGKSALVRGLFAAGLGEGPNLYLGKRVEPFNGLVVSEEPVAAWRDCPPNARVSFLNKEPIDDPEEWDKYVFGLGKLAREFSSDLVVIDTISRASAHAENDTAATTRMMAPLRRLAQEHELAVLLLHHCGRSGHIRGSTALEAQSDCVLTISRVSDDIMDRRRRLSASSRLSGHDEFEYVMLPNGTLSLSVSPAENEKPPATAGSNPFAKRGA
ncbi:MAG: hypothetical protein C0467_27960 [Planctomycetaceae bacterium]|nr:hypothetical protein [Planctomycetaceae bacterium]